MKLKTVGILLVCICLLGIVIGELSLSETTGTLEVSTRCHNNVFSKYVTIWDDDQWNKTNTAVTVELNPNGKYEGRFVPGNYTVYLYDGNGGQPETQKVRVYAGYQSRVFFIGHAVSGAKGDGAARPTVFPTINPEIPKPAVPVASFTYSPTTIYTSTQVQFTDTSKNATSWYWSVVNSADYAMDSNEQNPTFTFGSYGSWHVNLLVENENGYDTIGQYIYVNPDPTPQPTPTPTPTPVPTTTPTPKPTHDPCKHTPGNNNVITCG